MALEKRELMNKGPFGTHYNAKDGFPFQKLQHRFNFKVILGQPQCRGGCFQMDAVSGFLSREDLTENK